MHLAVYGGNPALWPVMPQLQAAYWRRQRQIGAVQAMAIWRVLAEALKGAKPATGNAGRVEEISAEEMMRRTGML